VCVLWRINALKADLNTINDHSIAIFDRRASFDSSRGGMRSRTHCDGKRRRDHQNPHLVSPSQA
jgi:hypothetical protein